MGGKGDPLGIVQDIEMLSYYSRIHAQTKNHSREWDVYNFLGFRDTNRFRNSSQKIGTWLTKKKKRKKRKKIKKTFHWVKIKENKKRAKYLDLARELRKLWDMKVTVIPTVIGALGPVSKSLIMRLEWVGNRRMCREHPNYSNLTFDLWVSSIQDQVNGTIDPSLDSSALLPIYHAASHGCHHDKKITLTSWNFFSALILIWFCGWIYYICWLIDYFFLFVGQFSFRFFLSGYDI